MVTTLRPCLAVVLLAVLAGCSGSMNDSRVLTERERTDQQRIGSIFGDDGLVFGAGRRARATDDQTAGIGVNSFLWRAALDTTSFLPIASADPFGGTIISDWYTPPDAPNERFKVNVYILGRQLRSDGVRAAVFRQARDPNGSWRDVNVGRETATQLENAILARARELRVAQGSNG